MLPINRKHSFLVTGCRALKSTNAVYKNNISTTYMRNMDIFLYLKKKGIALFKEKTNKPCIAHCETMLHFSNHNFEHGLWIEHTSFSHVNISVNKILVVMFACSKTNYYFFRFVLETKKKREYIRIWNHRAFSKV